MDSRISRSSDRSEGFIKIYVGLAVDCEAVAHHPQRFGAVKISILIFVRAELDGKAVFYNAAGGVVLVVSVGRICCESKRLRGQAEKNRA